VILISIVGLALAFGAFYAFSWPSTLAGKRGDHTGFAASKPKVLVHTGQFLFKVTGRRDVKISTVKLMTPSPGLELVAIRIGGSEAGALTGEHPEFEALPRAAGAVLRAGAEGAFLVSFRALDPGRFSFEGIEVTYQTGWLTRTVKLGPRVTVRVPGPSTTPSATPT